MVKRVLDPEVQRRHSLPVAQGRPQTHGEREQRHDKSDFRERTHEARIARQVDLHHARGTGPDNHPDDEIDNRTGQRQTPGQPARRRNESEQRAHQQEADGFP